MHAAFRSGFEKWAVNLGQYWLPEVKPIVTKMKPNLNNLTSRQEGTKAVNSWIKENPRPTSEGGIKPWWKH